MLIQLRSRGQLTLPLKVRQKLEIKDGMYFEIKIKKDGILLKPLKHAPKKIPKDEQWFWTEAWQKKERSADKAIKKGRIVGPFDKAENLVKSLKS